MTGFDISTAKYDKARRMLQSDLIAWITTVDGGGAPHAVPVWFYWHDDRAIVFSEPHTVKVAHVRQQSPVLLHLDAGGPFGDDVVILHGRAEVSPDDAATWLSRFREGYERKYAEATAAYGAGVDDIVAKFSAAIVFTPERVQAW